MKGPKAGIVTASFRADESVSSFEGKSCILLVSVGQDYHEGEELAATIDLVNRSRFRSCTVMLADTLQRHNFSSNLSETEAYRLSLARGDDWICRNEKGIATIKNEGKIVRWDECLRQPGYAELKNMVSARYHQDEQYQQNVNTTVLKFIDRVKKRDQDGSIDLKRVFDGCLEYLLEECPIIMPLWAAQGYDFIIYPQPLTVAMASTRSIFVQPEYPGKAQWLSLKFKRRNLENSFRLSAETADTSEKALVNVS